MGKHKKGLLKGAKFSSRHSTIIPVATPLLRVIKAWPEVTKIVLSTISNIGAGPGRIKLSPITAGFKLVVKGGRSIQVFFVYVEKVERDKVATKIKASAEELNLQTD